MGGIPECYTNPLDHEEQVDFATGTQAVFDQENDKDVLGQCDKVRPNQTNHANLD